MRITEEWRKNFPDEQSPNFEDRSKYWTPPDAPARRDIPAWEGTMVKFYGPEIQAKLAKMLEPYDDPAIYGKYLGLPDPTDPAYRTEGMLPGAPPMPSALPPRMPAFPGAPPPGIPLPPRRPAMPSRFADVPGSSPNFEDRTAAMGATPYSYYFGPAQSSSATPRGPENVRTATPRPPILWPEATMTPRESNAVEAAFGEPIDTTTPRPQPPASQGINVPYRFSPEARAAGEAYRNIEDLPMYGPTAGLQLPVSPLAQGYKLTPVEGDPFETGGQF